MFHEQVKTIAHKISKQEKDKAEYLCDQRPEINVVFLGGSTHWGQYEPFSLQKTNKSLQIIFMPYRLGRIQQRWLRLEIFYPFMVKVSILKQSAAAFGHT